MQEDADFGADSICVTIDIAHPHVYLSVRLVGLMMVLMSTTAFTITSKLTCQPVGPTKRAFGLSRREWAKRSVRIRSGAQSCDSVHLSASTNSCKEY